MQDMPEPTGPETILAFDYGRRRIGVAVGQTITASASPLGVVNNDFSGPDTTRIDALIKEWRPHRLVVGVPMHVDGSASDLLDFVNQFIAMLSTFELPIETIDERYTSIEAETALKDARAAGTRGRISKEAIDSAAAVFIAERYLAGRGN
jgi:putative Holliday junction resolvase